MALCPDTIAPVRDPETERKLTVQLFRTFPHPATCKSCQHQHQIRRVFAPRHEASSRCESGKRPHCTCDSCF